MDKLIEEYHSVRKQYYSIPLEKRNAPITHLTEVEFKIIQRLHELQHEIAEFVYRHEFNN